MRTWNVYMLSKSGVRVKITTVYASTEGKAKGVAARQLDRPGRHSIYLQWIDSGCIVEEV